MNTKHKCNDRDLAAATCVAKLDIAKGWNAPFVDCPFDGVILHSGIRKDTAALKGRIAVKFWHCYTHTDGDEARSRLVEEVFDRGVHAAIASWEAQDVINSTAARRLFQLAAVVATGCLLCLGIAFVDSL